MLAFSSWARGLHSQLAEGGFQLTLSQAQEVLASGLGHRTLASFRQSDLAQIDQAYAIVVSPELALERTLRLGITTPECPEVVFSRCVTASFKEAGGNCHLEQEDWFYVRVWELFMNCAHPVRDQFIRAKSATVADAQCSTGKALTPLSMAQQGWEWIVQGTVRCDEDSTGWALPVVGRVRFPMLGRRLLGPGALVALQATGASFEEPFDFAGGDYSYLSDSVIS